MKMCVSQQSNSDTTNVIFGEGNKSKAFYKDLLPRSLHISFHFLQPE